MTVQTKKLSQPRKQRKNFDTRRQSNFRGYEDKENFSAS